MGGGLVPVARRCQPRARSPSERQGPPSRRRSEDIGSGRSLAGEAMVEAAVALMTYGYERRQSLETAGTPANVTSARPRKAKAVFEATATDSHSCAIPRRQVDVARAVDVVREVDTAVHLDSQGSL